MSRPWTPSRTLAAAALAAAALFSFVVPRGTARAQIANGGYWLYQAHQPAPVGFAWASDDHTIEYWAYVVGEYRFPDQSNVDPSRWQLQATFAPPRSYSDFADFESSVLAMPGMAGKTIQFQHHSVAGETIQN